jgi:hypothetical protein
MRQDKGENCDGPGVVGLVITHLDKEGAKSKGMLPKGILLNTVYAHPERRERRMKPDLFSFLILANNSWMYYAKTNR